LPQLAAEVTYRFGTGIVGVNLIVTMGAHQLK